jgi:hypothetical protein
MRTMIADKVLTLAGTLIQWCMDALDAAIWESRETHGKAAAGQGVPAGREGDQGFGDRSRCRLHVAEGKPKSFFYLDHCTVDSSLAIITNTYATSANGA